MNAKQHLEKLTGYNSRLVAIDQDSRYTNAGKAPMIAALREEMLKQIEALPGDLAAEYKAARVQFDKTEQALQQARNAWREGWDYARLNYVTESVRATVNAAHDMQDIEDAYKTAQGDKYQIRAWNEIGAPLTHDKFGGVMAGQFLTEAKRAAEALSNTPEVAKAQQASDAVVKNVLGLRADTFSIADVIGSAGFGFKSYQVEELGKSIEVSRKFDGGGWMTTVKFADENPAPAGSEAQPGGEAAPAAASAAV